MCGWVGSTLCLTSSETENKMGFTKVFPPSTFSSWDLPAMIDRDGHALTAISLPYCWLLNNSKVEISDVDRSICVLLLLPFLVKFSKM
jgi:hypothetical protein